MPTKDRLLVLLKALGEKTDDETFLTTAELRAILEAEGLDCSIRTLRKDVQALQDTGFDISVQEKDGGSTRYAYIGREWSEPEVQVLVDAVSAAQFIPQERSEEFIRKLSVMAGPSYREGLVPEILISEHVKAKNRKMIYTVQAVRRAIERDKKISFKYLRYNEAKEQVPKHEGTPAENYIVSPYATVWNNDRYYLVGWSDKRKKVTTFRIDRMEVPSQLPNKRVPPPEDFDVRDYTDKVFWMFDGPEETVTLRFAEEILDQVIDRFGEGVELETGKAGTGNGKSSHFTVTVPVRLSTTFYAWVFQFVGKMSILAPEHVRTSYAGYLEEALDDVLGED